MEKFLTLWKWINDYPLIDFTEFTKGSYSVEMALNWAGESTKHLLILLARSIIVIKSPILNPKLIIDS
jgi:hypothetical protein